MNQDTSECRCDELVRLIAQKEHDPDLAEKAWGELYSRHADDIHRKLAKARKIVGLGFDAGDVVQEVFSRLYFKVAAEFSAENFVDADHAFNHVRKWLYEIARLQLLKMQESRGAACEMPVNHQEWDESRSVEEPDFEISESDAAVRRAAQEALSERELEVLWLKLHYFDADAGDKGESKPPPEELASIAEDLGIKVDSVRQVYKRALKKVEAKLDEATVVSRST